jgi:RNA polymerase sigma-70 factor (ECF subfamily)
MIRNRDNAEEIVQKTFVKIWENRNKINVTTSIQSYLYRATRNSAIDFIRKSKNEKQKVEEMLLNRPEQYDEIKVELSSYQIREKIFLAMEQLKPKCKEIFRLHKFEGLTYQEIADHLEISKRSVEDNIARGLRELHGILKGKI